MARHVKCYITGEEGTSDVFVKHGNHYYKSEKIYQDHIKELDYRNKIINLIIYDYMQYPKEVPFPTIINKRLKELEHIGYETIYRTLEAKDSDIRKALKEKTFNGEYPKMMYILAIVKNHMFDIWKIVLAEKREERKKEKQGYSLNIEDAQIINNPKQNVKDISKYLEDWYEL